MKFETVKKLCEITLVANQDPENELFYGVIFDLNDTTLDGLANSKKARFAVVQEQFYDRFPAPSSVLYIPHRFDAYIEHHI